MIPRARTISLRLGLSLLFVAAPIAAQAGMLTTTGSQAAVTVPDSPALVPSTGYTVEAWFYFNPAAPGGSARPTILRKNTLTPSYLLRSSAIVGGFLEFYANTGGNYHVVGSSVQTPVNSWHHIAGTHDGQVARLYLDGVQIGSLAVPGPPGFVPGALEIAKGDPGQESWHGSLDEVRIWSVAKTAAQIQASMMFERDNVPNLVAAWHFNGNYLDTTGNHHGVPNGQVTIEPSTSPVLADEISAPATSPIGAALPLTVKSSVPNLPYMVDVSVTGDSPGIYLAPPIDKTLPLNQPLLNFELGSYFDSMFVNFAGVIGPNNLATATLNVPDLPTIIGAQVWGSYVLLDPAYPQGIRWVGNGTVTTLTDHAPIVASVVPATSPVLGGAVVSIQGNYFASGASVMIGTANATNVLVVDSQTITCNTPAQTVGPKTVKVTNPDSLFGTLANGITYVPNLVILAIAPAAALPGATVSIGGLGFIPGLQLSVGGIPVVPTSVLPNLVTWQVPPGVPCDALVTVTNPDAQSQSILWNRTPTITQAVGATGPASGGGPFVLLGSALLGTTVTVGGANATILNAAPNSLSVQAPPGSPGPAPIVVSSITGCSDTATYLYQ